MSVTKDFNTSIGKYSRQDVISLLSHAQALEAMWKRYQFEFGEYMDQCPVCRQNDEDGHEDDCELGNLMKGVE